MKYTNEQYAEMIAELLVGDKIAVLDNYRQLETFVNNGSVGSILHHREVYPLEFESLCHRVHKALLGIYPSVEIELHPSGLISFLFGDIEGPHAYGESSTHEEALLNVGMDWFKKEKQ